MSLRTPMARVLGLGSAKEGVEHWWWQRLTALALVPLGLWFTVCMVSLIGSDYATVREWLTQPLNMTLLIALAAALLHHAQLGLQVIIEDYIHHEGWKLTCLLTAKFFAAVVFIWLVVRLFTTA